MFTKPQDVLKCFDRSVKILDDVNVPWELKNEPIQWRETARDLNIF